MYNDENYFGYTEVDALEYFLKNIDRLGKKVSKILLKPHPSETARKYDWVKNFNFNISIAMNKSLTECINESNTVVGCDTMALVVALYGDRRVISSIPPGGKKGVIPFKGIESFQKLNINNI